MEDGGGDGYPHYSWHSIVAIPRSKLTPALAKKYTAETEAGFCNCAIAGGAPAAPRRDC